MGKRTVGHEAAPAFNGPQVTYAKRLRSNGSGPSEYIKIIDGQIPTYNVRKLGSSANPIILDSEEPIGPNEDISATTAAGQDWKLSFQKVQEWRQNGKKKIYCVRHGHRPGFYSEWNEAENQVKGFKDNVHASYPPTKKGLTTSDDQSLKEAISSAEHFMNHKPNNCNYSACKGDCRPVSPPNLSDAPALATVQDEQSSSHEVQNAYADVDYSSSLSKESSTQSSLQSSQSEEQPYLIDSDPTGYIKKKHLCLHCQKDTRQPGERLCPECLESKDRVSGKIERIAKERHLVDEQKQLLELAGRGKNIFFTGAAGTGKSTVLKAIVSLLKECDLDVRVIAPTGIAALGLELHATTLHTYAGVTPSLAKNPLKVLRKMAHETRRWNRFNQTDVLIIDEISMVPSNMLTRLSAMMDDAVGPKRECTPFGGVQLIVTGDFFQLPPVKPFETCVYCGEDLVKGKRQETVHSCMKSGSSCSRPDDCHEAISDTEKWAFRSPAWEDCEFTNVELQKIHRQADPYFANILNRVRRGKGLSPRELGALQAEKQGFQHDKAVKLCPLRRQVDSINEKHMQQLRSTVHCFTYVDEVHKPHSANDPSRPEYVPESPHQLLEKFSNDHRYNKFLELKAGMKVLLLQNLDPEARLANGSRGTIVDFERDDNVDKQPLPLKHRSFARGQVANFKRKQGRDIFWPVVEFQNGVKRTIYVHAAISELGQTEPHTLLSRTQIPLTAGWAMTIHKAQGMTLEDVVVDSKDCFEPGQTYVALSRAKKLSGMQVTGALSANKILPDPTVKAFMDEAFPTTGSQTRL